MGRRLLWLAGMAKGCSRLLGDVNRDEWRCVQRPHPGYTRPHACVHEAEMQKRARVCIASVHARSRRPHLQRHPGDCPYMRLLVRVHRSQTRTKGIVKISGSTT